MVGHLQLTSSPLGALSLEITVANAWTDKISFEVDFFFAVQIGHYQQFAGCQLSCCQYMD